uniref:Uncharacterized protein n=1 Tax=Rhizophagus irregularis (strain DAOM 181602 / DAOM 197198 / MUCL 43194) TaxID=747089 RepID=U9UBC2_RHIID
MVDNKLLPILSQNLFEILNDEEYYDITIEIFRAHIELYELGRDPPSSFSAGPIDVR